MSMNDATPGKNYTVARVEPVLKTNDVLARVFNLVPGDKIPWHFHKLSTDHYFVLSGVLTIHTEHPTQQVTLQAGDRWKVEIGTHHEVSNASDQPVSFLLLQGTGGYDWIKVEQTQE